jgi:hypothetical protein
VGVKEKKHLLLFVDNKEYFAMNLGQFVFNTKEKSNSNVEDF